MKTILDFNVKQKRALVRCDFNAPLTKEGLVSDDFRIKAALPTIEYLIQNHAKVVLMSHLGDPGGKIVEELRLDKIQEKLMELLDLSVAKAPDCVGREIEKWTKEMAPGEILLLENLRFHKEEEENDDDFAKALSKLGDVYINEAFSACHRSHASVAGAPKYLPSGAGFLLKKEIDILDGLLQNPEKPLVAIIGGKKVETKSKLIDRISETADCVLVGGLIKKEIEEKKIILKYPEKIIGPLNAVDAKDIDQETITVFRDKIRAAKTIFWNGPVGKYEEEEFSKGTLGVARAIIESGAFSVIGGGETIDFVNRVGLADKFSHISTGGGAMMAYLSGDKLPGIEALK